MVLETKCSLIAERLVNTMALALCGYLSTLETRSEFFDGKTVFKRVYSDVLQVLLVYVLVYLIQWLPAIVYVWMFILEADIPFFFLFLLLVSINIGGLLNFIAYTFVRKRSGRAVFASPNQLASFHVKADRVVFATQLSGSGEN